MLSAFERRPANEDNTLWRQNAAIIRQLYQDERRTLKQVKAIMENERGFPVTPLPTWEVKLRELGIQKKLKAKDWSLIYQHVYPRLQHQGKKGFRKPTVVLIHGTKKPWDKCWKEIRRNRAEIQRHHQGPIPPLPSFITIRTPSPELHETIVQRKPLRDVHFLIQQLFQTTVVSLQPLFELGLSSLTEKNHTSTPDSVYKLCLQGIPFTILLEKASGSLLSPEGPHAVVRTGESQVCDDGIIPSSGQHGNFAVSGCINPLDVEPNNIHPQRLSEFTSASSAGQQLALNFDSHHYLSMVIYLLSNNLVVTESSSPHEVTVSDILQMTLEFVPRRLLSALFRNQLLSIKAGWERLLTGAQELKNKEAFQFFINIGIKNAWLELHDKGHEYLFFAAQMNCAEILRTLIDMGCHMASYPWGCSSSSGSIIVETINNSNLDCAKLLLQTCDINHEFRIGPLDHKFTHFAMFIEDFDDTIPDHVNCLKFLLEQGANVDYELQPGIFRMKQPDNMPSWGAAQEELQKDWPLSILDYVYYCHRGLFLELMKYSKKTAHFSRAMTLWNLEQGQSTLRQYLNSANPCGGAGHNSTTVLERKNYCLGILLAEQFLLSTIIPEKAVSWGKVAALSELDINLMWLPKTKKPPEMMLYATACLATSEEGQHKQKGSNIMQWLLGTGLQVSSEALLAAYTRGGITILQYLASFCNDIKVEGGKALVATLLKNDVSSAKLLLHLGVDPNSSMIATKGWEMTVFEAAACGSTLATMKYLVKRGVKPRTGILGSRPSLALVRMFLYHDVDQMFDKVQYIVDEHMMIYEPLWSSLPLLECCLLNANREDRNEKIFEFLLKKGAGLNVGSPLAVWISTGGGHQLVQQMLGAGANPNAYSFTKLDPDYGARGGTSETPIQAAAGMGDFALVCLLLEHGADLNAPANGQSRYSKAPLQAICAWDPVRREERLRKDKIVQLLLSRRADINAANFAGDTALMEAAHLGDISTAFTLLKYGASPNAVSKEISYWGRSTALDIAAEQGRLDMVKFLLNANALSSTAWSNGEDYEGAIERAKERGYLVVCELIKRHSAERHRWDVPSGIPATTSLGPHYTHQSLSLRTKATTALGPQSRRQLATADSPSITTVLDQTGGSSNTPPEVELKTGPVTLEAEARDNSITEVTDVSWLFGVEDIGDLAPLAEAGCDESRGATTEEAVCQAFHTEEAASGNEAWLYEPRGQSWVKENQQGAALLAPSSLDEDVFMGFPGYENS